jgi:uncharacterized membrane protein YoaK (UPF0700 family)
MLAAFIAGALSGAIGYVFVGFLSLIVPIVAVSPTAVPMRRRAEAT